MIERRGKVTAVMDADTLAVDVNLGLGVTLGITVRVLNLESWEIRSDQRWLAEAAREWVSDWVRVEGMVDLEIHKREKFGRWLANVRGVATGRDLATSVKEARLGWDRPSAKPAPEPSSGG